MKIGTEIAHVTRDSDTTFKVKRSRLPDRFTSTVVGSEPWHSSGRKPDARCEPSRSEGSRYHIPWTCWFQAHLSLFQPWHSALKVPNYFTARVAKALVTSLSLLLQKVVNHKCLVYCDFVVQSCLASTSSSTTLCVRGSLKSTCHRPLPGQTCCF